MAAGPSVPLSHLEFPRTVGPRPISTPNSFVNACFLPQSAHTLQVGGREAAAPASDAAGDGTGLVCNLDVFLAGRAPASPHFPKLYSSVSGLKLWGEEG